MKSCGVIVEYNPFHNGHLYHINESKRLSCADCIIAVMSGPFLQRGEPAIMDKWYRAKAALSNGADLVLELPYLYAVEHSDHFSQGAVNILSEAGVDTICFGSEDGSIEAFLKTHHHLETQMDLYKETLRLYLNQGDSFPEASRKGYEAVDFPPGTIDLTKPNNVLGYSYVKQMLGYNPAITPLTIERSSSQHHDKDIAGSIASATSIRREIKHAGDLTQDAINSLPSETVQLLLKYKEAAGVWHDWEHYFSLLHYKISTMREDELRRIHGVDEGLEHRLKRSIKYAESFNDFMNKLKTKRYTWTRLQRVLVHILVGTKKEEAEWLLSTPQPPYMRVLGMTQTGRTYLNQRKKQFDIPLITQPQQIRHQMLELEESASLAYYSVLPNDKKLDRIKRDYQAPIML